MPIKKDIAGLEHPKVFFFFLIIDALRESKVQKTTITCKRIMHLNHNTSVSYVIPANSLDCIYKGEGTPASHACSSSMH